MYVECTVHAQSSNLQNYIIMEEVAGQPCCNRDPATEIILSDGDIDRYLPLGAIQPKGFYPVTNVLVSGKLKSLKFQETWFDGRPWLEYSVSIDQAGCFYCRLFKPILNGRYLRQLNVMFFSRPPQFLTGGGGGNTMTRILRIPPHL